METKAFITTKNYILPSYQSDSSNDSAITCEFDEDALQREIIKPSDGYYEDAADPANSTSDFKELVFNFTCLALENTNVLNNYRLSEIVELIRPYYKPIIEIDPQTQKYLIFDRFGFIHKEMNEKEAFLQQVLIEILNSKSEKAWTTGNCENLKTLVREYGIPNELRPKIWLAIIRNKVSNNYNIENLLELAEETIQMFEFGIDEMNIRQIDLDICRTMPNHRMFNEKANGLDKLKKILVAYSIHVNPCVGYCQSMNFLAALLLIIFNGNEKHALMGLICIIDYCFPANYFDENLTGARADQMLLRDLILKKLASKIPYKDEEELNYKLNKYSSKIDEITGSLSLNWFLSLFHNAVPWQTRLYILDCFWLEGMKVLFRFGLALLPLENKLTYLDAKEGDNRIGDLINQMKEECARCHDVDLLRKIAFRQLTIPGRRELRVKRSIYLQRIQESLMAAKEKEEKLNEQTQHHSEPEIDLSSEDETEKRPATADASSASAKNQFKRSNSSFPQQPQQPANRLNWLRKRLSLANFYPLSMQRQAASAQKNAYRGLNGVRSCEAISRNGERLVQMIASPEHYQSRVLLQLRDCTYSHIFYPNRRSSIVLSDNEQHQNAILTLRNLYNKDLFLVGVSDDGKWVVLLDQLGKKFHCGWLKDSNVSVLILSVPFAVCGWYFDELSWQVICLDKENQLWRCDLADPARSSLCTDFLRKQLNNEPKSSSNLNMLAYDDKYCLLWAQMITKISSEDQTEEVLKRNSLSERMTLSLDLSSDDECVPLENGGHSDHPNGDHSNGHSARGHLNCKLGKKEDAVFRSSLEDLDDEEDSDPNDLCSCSTESPNGCDHDHLNDDAFSDEPFRSELLENKCVKNGTEKCVANVATQNFENEPIANRLLSRRVTISSIFRRNSLIIMDSSPTDPSALSDYLINKHGHANLSSTAKDQLKEQKEFQCTVRFALENRIRMMHKLFDSKQLNSSHSSFAPHSLQTQHSQQSAAKSQKRPRRHVYHQDSHKNDDLTKIDTNENLTRQQLFVFDSCSMELFGILKLDPLDGQLQRIFCLGGVAYCGFDDGSITAITVTLSGNSEQPTNRRQLLQPQPEDELVDLRVFNANNTVSMDTIIQQKLAEHLNSRSESMSSKESINSSPAKSNHNSTSIDEEEDDDEELVHFDAVLMNNSRKNSINQCASRTQPASHQPRELTRENSSIMNSFANLGSSITSSITNSLISSNTNSIFNSVAYTKERVNKTNSNSSSEFSFEQPKKRLENLSEDGVSGSAGANGQAADQAGCKSGPHSPTARCSRAERNLPSLTTIFNNSVNSAFLVLALYKSGKLHCIYLKSGCVQERKLFRIDVQLKSELPVNSLRIVNAFRMNWSDEQNSTTTDDEQAANNLSDLITDLNGAPNETSQTNAMHPSNRLNEADEFGSNESESTESTAIGQQDNQAGNTAAGLERIDENNNSRPANENETADQDRPNGRHSDASNDESNKEARLSSDRAAADNEPSENNGDPREQKKRAAELNGTNVNQVHQSKDANERAESSGDPKDANNANAKNSEDGANTRRDSSQLNEELFEQSKCKLSKRSSINANQCNYLVTLWSPHPINRLVNVKL